MGYGLTLSWQDQDALSSIGGMQDSFEIDGGMQDLNSIRPFEKCSNRRDRDEDSESGGMKTKLVAGCWI